MRVSSDTRLLEVDPGNTAAVVVEVVNTSEVIDGVTAQVIGMSDQLVTSHPALLPLFPDAMGQMTLALAVPSSHPAGRHPLTVELISHGARAPSQFVDVDLNVSARPAMRLNSRPRVIRARRAARFILEIANEGNIPLDVNLSAVDPERSTQAIFIPQQLRIEPGTLAPVILNVRGPRMFTGAEIDRTVVVEASARPVQLLLDPEVEPEVLVVRETTVQLRQRPLLSRGLLTVLILLCIVGLWAAAFLLGLGKVFGGDPMTKAAPASFFAASTAAGGGAASGAAGGASGAGGSAAGSRSDGGSGAAPAGALAKSGQLPPGVGGEIVGKVIAANDQQPVGRILVQAWRVSSSGPVVVSSAATQADGTYTLAGLFPTDYYIAFSAAGYVTQWYPNAPTQTAGQIVSAVAQGSTTGINATIVGNPATIAGKVNPGDTLTPPVTTVTARPLTGANTATAAAVATTDATGSYLLNKLPAPGSYELTFTTPGYQASTVVDTVAGGDQRLEPTVILGASQGQITGTVLDGTSPLGGATVSTTVGGQALTVITPTTGQVGAFVLGNLPTPATYVVTFTAPGHGSTTTIVDLTAGQSRAGLNIILTGGTGSVTGKVVGPGGNGLGGVTVSVGGTAGASGGNAPIGTTTLTAGSIGSFAINGLNVPGSYTLTFTLAGYSSASVPISLTQNGGAPSVTVRLESQLGSIAGRVTTGPATQPSAYPGATVTATNGQRSWTSTSNTVGGGYVIADLSPGSYSVTVTAAGHTQQTALVTVVAGKTVNQPLHLGP
ncbi:MAG: carboxypeptidase-like regulatory domain-containing protein [Actinomycetota bacterium]|nr:carboxypeptidase-like regulatory domain-containing protein [Actinomycetota bacterium]